ncbi:Uncharacterized protein Adt_33165 [Abeliophyllum distichum]|uniref:Uncharacterized protein n=1 Tax=Abeliophyllum distichum TaxID=126358 RepID=A0ABD1QVH2_9LAMI
MDVEMDGMVKKMEMGGQPGGESDGGGCDRGGGVIHELESVRITDAKEWFKDLLTSGKWLVDDNVDLATYLLRHRAAMYPKSFEKSKNHYGFLIQEHAGCCINDKRLMSRPFYVSRLPLRLRAHEVSIVEASIGRVVHMCTLWWSRMHTGLQQRLIFLMVWYMFMTPDKSCLAQGQIEKHLESVCHFIYVLAKSVNIPVRDRL